MPNYPSTDIMPFGTTDTMTSEICTRLRCAYLITHYSVVFNGKNKRVLYHRCKLNNYRLPVPQCPLQLKQEARDSSWNKDACTRLECASLAKCTGPYGEDKTAYICRVNSAPLPLPSCPKVELTARGETLSPCSVCTSCKLFGYESKSTDTVRHFCFEHSAYLTIVEGKPTQLLVCAVNSKATVPKGTVPKATSPTSSIYEDKEQVFTTPKATVPKATAKRPPVVPTITFDFSDELPDPEDSEDGEDSDV